MKRRFVLLTFDNCLDISIFIIFFIRIYLEHKHYDNGVGEQSSDGARGSKYFRNTNIENNHADLLSYLYSIASACLW